MQYQPSNQQPNCLTTHITCLLLLLLTLSITSCTLNSANPFAGSTTTTQSGNTTLGPGTVGLQVYVEPDAGDGFLIDAIRQAQKSILLEMYLLTNRKIITVLEDAAHRGIDVRVMLEMHPYGGGSISPSNTLDRLAAAGVKTQGTNPAFALTHEKGMVIDNQTAYIMTSNFSLAAFGGNTSTKNREYIIVDNNKQEIQAVVDIFNADWNRNHAQYNAPNLIVSPANSRHAFTTLINNAQKTLLIEAEEMQDSQIEQALINAAKRGVQVQVILPTPKDASNDYNSRGIATIKQGGVQVKEDSKLYMHAKIIVADGQKAFVGSENISTASLDRNRELGILIADSSVIATLQQTFQQDWTVSQSAFDSHALYILCA
jgi:cardiolipin synthase A/B